MSLGNNIPVQSPPAVDTNNEDRLITQEMVEDLREMREMTNRDMKNIEDVQEQLQAHVQEDVVDDEILCEEGKDDINKSLEQAFDETVGLQNKEEQEGAIAGALPPAAEGAEAGVPPTECVYPSIFQYELQAITDEEKEMKLSEEELCRRKEERFWQAFQGFIDVHQDRSSNPNELPNLEKAFRDLEQRDRNN